MSRAADAARFRFGPTALACCAGKRFAFPQLRTLSGSNPMRWAQTKTVPFRGPFPLQWWAMRDVACGWRRPLSLRACGPRVLRWKTLRVSSASHPVGFESHVLGPNKNGPLARTVSNSVVGDEGCPRAAGAARAPLRRSAPRVLRWKTLRVSSAPHPCGFESHALGPKMKGPHSWEPIKSVVGDEGFEPPALCV